MECNTLKCIVIDCWWAIVAGFGHFIAFVWPVLVVYAVLYAAGAAAFLINLRFKAGESGRLEVLWNSWAYMLARPYRYGQITKYGESFQRARRAEWFGDTSICLIYARLFNMLLFVWPVLLLWFALACAVGTIFLGGLLGAAYVRPNLSNDAFLDAVEVRDIKHWYQLPLVYELSLFLAFLVVFKWATFLRLLGTTGKVLLCIAPILVFIGLVVYFSRKVYRKVYREHGDRETTVGALTEYVEARKEKFCKIVEIK